MEPLRNTDPGSIGPYRLLSRLGAGTTGEVFLARSRGGRAVAVKVVRPGLAQDPSFRARFAGEMAIASAVGGAFTPPVLDADPHAIRPWLATAYVPGPSLREAVGRHGPLTEAAVAALGSALAETLFVVHRAGIVHRDIKPGNVLLAADGPRLIDFGLSGAAEAPNPGTPGYAAPEPYPGPAGDVFSLGAVLAYAATGAGPFGDGPAPVLRYRAGAALHRLAGVPDSLRPAVAACLDPDPARRPAPERLQEMLPPAQIDWPAGIGEDIAERERTLTLTMAGGVAGDGGGGGTGPRGIGRRRVLAIGAAAVLVGVGGGATGIAVARTRPRRRPRARPTPSPVMALPAWTATRRLQADGAIVSGAAVFLDQDHGRPRLTALDVGGGRKLWSLPAGTPAAPGTGGPVGQGGTVYALLSDFRLHALDPRTGRSRWAREVPGLILNEILGVLGSMVICKAVHPVLTERLLAFHTSGALAWNIGWGGDVTVPATGALLYQNVPPGQVRALDAATGRPRWRTSVDDNVAVTGTGADAMYLLGRNVTALEAATGRQRWVFSPTGIPLNGDSRILEAGGRVFVGGGRVTTLEAATGRALWQKDHSVNSGLVLANGVLYAGTLDYFTEQEVNLGPSAYGLDAATGATRWIYPGPDKAKDDGWWFCAGERWLLAAHENTAAAFPVG